MSHADFQRILVDHRAAVALPDHQERILRLIAGCRTQDAGVHILHCLQCGGEMVRCNSCRNRHCPLCQGVAQAAWVRAREEDLLPIPYLHGVCTLPHELLPLVHARPAVVYGCLMRCAQQSLADLCADPRHLGATVGQLAVLHTWGSDLREHPHVHLMVTGGGLRADGTWRHAKVSKKKGTVFLVPVRCWRNRFRGLMLRALRTAYAAGAFDEPDGTPSPLWPDRSSFNRLLGTAGRKRWVVYLKRPFGGPRQVVRYLGRYTHRVALNTGRIAAYDGETVTLTYTDYRHGGRRAERRFTGPAFIRAFARHILPAGFRRLRMSGLWGPRVRRRNLAQARSCLTRESSACQRPSPPAEPSAALAPASRPTCPHCGAAGKLVVRTAQRWSRRAHAWYWDAPPRAQAQIRHHRLQRPVPIFSPGGCDPEDLFARSE